MKPNFALTLSFDGIGLLHRAYPGWHLVGDVALDCADLATELSELRQKALALDPSGLRTKLVLPNDQVKFLNIQEFEGDVGDMDAAARAALEGATPYPVDELAYDWTFNNGVLSIAAVARETLAEAEAFAVDHQFNPVCYVATPDAGDYAGEPFFGVSAWAKLDAQGDIEIEPDSSPIRVIGASKLPEPATPDAADAADAAQDSVPQEQSLADEEVVPEPRAPAPSPVEDELKLNSESDPSQQDAIKPTDDISETGITIPPAPAEDSHQPEIAASFASIRARGKDGTTPAPRLDGVVRDNAPPRITLGVASEADTPSEGVANTGVSDATMPVEEDVADLIPVLAAQNERAAQNVVETSETPEITKISPRATAVKPAFFTRRSRSVKKAEAGISGVPEASDEKQRMTIFGARDQSSANGKPRYLGLLLTAVLLLFLIGVAAWASIFMDEGLARFFRSDDTPVVANLPTSEEAEAALSEEEEIELASLIPDQPVSVLDDPATEILSRINPSDLSPDEAKARYAATGIWQLAPEPSQSPQPRELEDFYQTSLDPNPDFQDAVALPSTSAALTDGIMFTPASPPPAGTRFTLDPRGFILATPDGATTPDGVIVFAGQPKVTPPSELAKPGAVSAGQSNSNEQPAVQQVLIRPRARPADAAEKIERRKLNGRTLNELASLRPRLRPESAQEAAEAARKKAAAEALALQQAKAAAATDPDAIESAVAAASQATIAFSGATPQAVRTSIKPRTKPSNFDTIVKRATRNQATTGDDDAASGSEAVAVRATQRVSPKIPSKASVSKQATQRNAIRFKRVNLIGVYGTSSNRRALVRMSNGRYKKVKVGDRLDGGRVSAIGDSDLRYTKSGRSVVLKMPRG